MSDLNLWAGTRKGLFRLSRSKQWRIDSPYFLGDPVTAVFPDSRDGAMYTALLLGHFGPKLWRLDDDASEFAALSTPSHNGSSEISTYQVWSFAAAEPDKPGTLWAGTIPGGLFYSSDRGGSWALVESLWNLNERSEWFGGGYDDPGIHSICVDPRDPRNVAIGVSCGGVWQTGDAGKTWSVSGSGMRAAYMPPEKAFDPNVQDPHLLVRCAAKPDQYWVQHHNGVFRSSDGLESWVEIETPAVSPFGFAVAVHPGDPDTAWFAPAIKDEIRVPVDARMVVTRTRDGGNSFDILSRGLPGYPSYDLVYRHSLIVDSTGEILALGSTTGGLWVSEDQGDTWSPISTHLPPIYCLAFAGG